MSLLPIFLKVRGRPCLVVGAGEVATGKIESLVAAGAHVTVVAPWGTPSVETLHAQNALAVWHRRPFQNADVHPQAHAQGAPFVVIAATDAKAINRHVYQLCQQAGILCNAVDDIPNCDFFYGSVVQRDTLQIAISTAGNSPSLAQRLRREIEELLPHDLGPWLRDLGALRREVLQHHAASPGRNALLEGLAHRSVCESATCPSRTMALAAVPPAYDATSAPLVWLVGAGPGDPELLTLKALRVLARADLVLHDDLVPDAVLALVRAGAEIVNVGKRCGCATITQDQIHRHMIDGAQSGRFVVRLKSGDPLIFGRAGEEMDALREANISFEVVPGITAASSAAAALGCSLTDRRKASSILFSTAHTAEPATIAEPTRVVYMPGRDLSKVALEWRSLGLPDDYPCVLVSRAGQPQQQIATTTLGHLHTVEPLDAPCLLLGGNALAPERVGKQAAAQTLHRLQGAQALWPDANANADGDADAG